MKVAILSESPADEAALRVLVDAILGVATEAPTGFGLRAPRGWPGVLKSLPAAVAALHYNSDAFGLVVVADSDGSAFSAEPPVSERLTQIRARLRRGRNPLGPRAAPHPLHIAAGLAVPAIEAWYLCGLADNVGESNWARQLLAGAHAPTEIKKLKRLVYGTTRPNLPLETKRARRALRDVARERLDLLTQQFPLGFGALLHDLRRWPSTAPA